MLKFGTRYYMPELARWTQQDPVKGQLTNPMSLNPYLYVGDNPINATDPSGRFGWADLGHLFLGVHEGLTAIGFFALGIYGIAAAPISYGLTIPFVTLPAWGAAVVAGIHDYEQFQYAFDED